MVVHRLRRCDGCPDNNLQEEAHDPRFISIIRNVMTKFSLNRVAAT